MLSELNDVLGHRVQLQALSDRLLEDMYLRWQMDQLAQNLQSIASPNSRAG